MTEQVQASEAVTWSTRIRDWLRFSELFRTRGRADVIYDLMSTDGYLTDRTLYRNVGYWQNNPKTLDDASEDLTQYVGEQLDLGPSDRLLDVGFGFGDQDLDLMKRFAPREIVGVNITRSQLDYATKRVATLGLSDRISYKLAPATQLPFEDNSFDKVVALECAFHFETRAQFFAEAFRVLRPGGRLVVVDLVPLPYDHLSLPKRLLSDLGLHIWKICKENVYDRQTYEQKLRESGFQARVQTIRDATLVPYAHFVMAELAKPARLARMNYGVAVMIYAPAERILTNAWGLSDIDYVLAVADKPK